MPGPQRPGNPTPINGATIHGILGQRGMRHRWELPLLGFAVALALLAYLLWWFMLFHLFFLEDNVDDGTVLDAAGGYAGQIFVLLMFVPLIFWFARAMEYARLRANAVRMSPNQFPEGYRMLVEAAEQFGLRRVPDAYVVPGSGTINAFAVGHGFRRFVAVYSDLFEVGGEARDPEALRYVISHEVGHHAAGHVSYFRLVFMVVINQIPFLGPALSRSQEYTADNYGYQASPQGALGGMAVLAAGKYLNADVNVNELADRAATEKGFWLHLVNWRSGHPIITWRTHALRDRSRHGALWLRPRLVAYPSTLPPAGSLSGGYPTPGDALGLLAATDRLRPAGTKAQFGRFPGVDYSGQPSIRQVQLSAPLLPGAPAPANPPYGFGPQGPQNPGGPPPVPPNPPYGG
ncbi:M48 family metallopeptidase [Janibacter alkaliphilus]